VDDARERGVTADAAHADRPVAHPELVDQLEDGAHRQRLAAARAQRVLGGEQQVGLRGDLLQRRGGGHDVPQAAARPPYAAVVRPTVLARSRIGPTPDPGWSWAVPPTP